MQADDAFYFDSEFTSKTPRDSPGVPASATAHELFRGFSFVAPCIYNKDEDGGPVVGAGGDTTTINGTTTAAAAQFTKHQTCTASSACVPVAGAGAVPSQQQQQQQVVVEAVTQQQQTSSLKLISGMSSMAFFDEYELLGELGRGSFSVVKLCQHRTSNQQYAVKVST